MDSLREWETAERAAVAAERLAANLDGVDPALAAVRQSREKAQALRRRADELMARVVQQLGDKAEGSGTVPGADPASDQTT